MAICFRIPPLPKSRCFCSPFDCFQFSSRSHRNPIAICCSQSDGNENTDSNAANKLKSKLSEQSSWEAKDSEGKDYLFRLGAEADNMNITVGARAGVIDDLFTGNFLGKDCNDYIFASVDYLYSLVLDGVFRRFWLTWIMKMVDTHFDSSHKSRRNGI